MEDFVEVSKGFSNGEFSPQEYEKMLNEDGIELKVIRE